jgi:hypothetical protein
MAFHLLKGRSARTVLYASHTMWRSHADFRLDGRGAARRMRGPATTSRPRSAIQFEGFHDPVSADGAVRRVAAGDG